MDHFALPDDELAVAFNDRSLHRNFMGYTTKADTAMASFGISSISYADEAYAQNTRKLSVYRKAIEAGAPPVERGFRLSKEDLLRRDLIQQLMCFAGVDGDVLGEAHGVDFARHFAQPLEALEPFVEDGLVERTENGFRTTFLGMVFVRNIGMLFDEYLNKPGGKKVTYSRTL